MTTKAFNIFGIVTEWIFSKLDVLFDKLDNVFDWLSDLSSPVRISAISGFIVSVFALLALLSYLTTGTILWEKMLYGFLCGFLPSLLFARR